MSLADWIPFNNTDEPVSDVNGFLEDFQLSIINRYATPRTDVYQTDREIIVKSEVPGLSCDDMEVLIEDTYIRLSGQKHRMKTLKDEEICHSEQFYGSFSRIIPLPSRVQPAKAVSECKDGILSIIIPKSAGDHEKESR